MRMGRTWVGNEGLELAGGRQHEAAQTGQAGEGLRTQLVWLGQGREKPGKFLGKWDREAETNSRTQ